MGSLPQLTNLRLLAALSGTAGVASLQALIIVSAAMIPAELIIAILLGNWETGLVLRITLRAPAVVPPLFVTLGLLVATCLALASGE